MRTLAASLLLLASSILPASTLLAQTTQPQAAAPAEANANAYGKPVSTDINPGKMITYKSEGNDIQAYEVTPKVSGPHPSVLIVSDIFGMTDWVKEQADHLAHQGYTVLVPNIYSRLANSSHGLDAQQAWLDYDQTSDQQIQQDISAAIEFLQRDGSPTAGQPLGIVGYDLGGIFAMKLAATDLRVSAAVNYYGRIIYAHTSHDRPMSPVEDLFNLSAPLLSFYGNLDPQVPASQVDALQSRLANNPNAAYYEIVRYPDVGHGFLVPTRQGYNPEAAKKAEETTRLFLARYLRAAPKPPDDGTE